MGLFFSWFGFALFDFLQFTLITSKYKGKDNVMLNNSKASSLAVEKSCSIKSQETKGL